MSLSQQFCDAQQWAHTHFLFIYRCYAASSDNRYVPLANCTTRWLGLVVI
jgi:hypothetical protein